MVVTKGNKWQSWDSHLLTIMLLKKQEKNLSGKKENDTNFRDLKIVLPGHLITFLFLVLDP